LLIFAKRALEKIYQSEKPTKTEPILEEVYDLVEKFMIPWNDWSNMGQGNT